MAKTLSKEEQEALFQALIRKIPSVDDPQQLLESSTLALAMLLRRDGDADLRDGLTRRIHEIVAEVHADQSDERTTNQMRFAARQCIKVLQAAKERRVPRAAGADWARAAAPAKPAAARSHGRTHLKVAAVVALLVLAGGATMLWQGGDEADEGSQGAESPLAAEIRLAAEGTVPTHHVFGGALTVTSVGGRPMVKAEAVPAKACVTAGWQLVRKGVLSINGVTPLRVSAAKLSELCNREDGVATLTWMPKQ